MNTLRALLCKEKHSAADPALCGQDYVRIADGHNNAACTPRKTNSDTWSTCRIEGVLADMKKRT